jgi:hypothetical protein
MSHTTTLNSIAIKDVRALQKAVAELKKQGVRCDLVPNCAPRLFYSDQLQRHLGRKDEVADYVLKLHDSPYDMAFLKEKDGSFTPVFDSWRGAKPEGCQISTKDGRIGIRDILGVPLTDNTPLGQMTRAQAEMVYGVGKFTREYAKHAALNKAMALGRPIKSIHATPDGKVQIKIKLS